MAKKRYKFNPQTLTYEVITIPFRIKFYRALRKVLIGFILASIVNVLFSFFFYTPKMYRISRDNNELLIKYNMLNDKLRAATARLQEIRHRDNSVYCGDCWRYADYPYVFNSLIAAPTDPIIENYLATLFRLLSPGWETPDSQQGRMLSSLKRFYRKNILKLQSYE